MVVWLRSVMGQLFELMVTDAVPSDGRPKFVPVMVSVMLPTFGPLAGETADAFGAR